jgi:hypothetical protein
MIRDRKRSKRARKVGAKSLSVRQKKELGSLASLRDDQVDTKSIPEVRNWSGAKRGLFRR